METSVEKNLTFDLKRVLGVSPLRGLWRMIGEYHVHYLIANLSLGLAALFKMATFLLLRYFVDNVLGRPQANFLLPWVALGFIGLRLWRGGLTYTSGRLAAYTAEDSTRKLRNYLFDHIQRLTFAYHSKARVGELIERVTSDVDAVRRFFAEQAVGVGRILFLFAINFAALLYIHARLALLSVAVLPFVLLASLYFFKKVTKVYEEYQAQEAVLSTVLQENLSGVRVVKAFARQDYEKAKFEKENWGKFLKGRTFILMHSAFWPTTDILCGLQMLVGYYIGARMAIAGEITVGDYLAYTGLVVWLIWPLRNLGRLIVQTSTGVVSFKRVLDIVRQEREPLDEGDYQPQGNVRGAIAFRKVCFEYDGDEDHVLQDITFECQPGQVVALLGPTGSGKTTLVNLLPRFYDYTGGIITLDGVELKRYPRRYLRSQIGIVEQEPFLFSRTIRENIVYGVERSVTQEEIEAAARAAAIHETILTFPQGYDTIVGERGITLSGGQKQRVAIARTLIKNPRILILDDSTSSVDTETEAEIRAALEVLMRGRTTFIIAHRIQSVMNADLILVLEKGRIVQRGTHAELLEQPGIYRQIYDLQMRIESELEEEIKQAELSATRAVEPEARPLPLLKT